MDSDVQKTHSFHTADDNWLKFSNPISLWSRFFALPIGAIIFWCRKYMGWWCLAPGILLLFWLFFNPLLLKKPYSTRNWASRAVLGERVFLNRDMHHIPENHDIEIHAILYIIYSTGVILTMWSIVYYSVWGTITGIILASLGKSWLWDRMVWLYEDMKNDNDIYKSWDY